MDHASLEAFAGEVLAIVGPSGSGKSTLLNIMGLLDRPTDGRVEILGTEVSTLTERERDRFRGNHLGFVFQSSHLMGHENTRVNVALGLRLQGRPFRERVHRAVELLHEYGLGHRASSPSRLLSGGERQRAAVARAVAGAPALILADEPTGSLDSANARTVMGHLRSLAEQGAAVVVITHDPSVAAWADRRLEMLDGRLSAGQTENAVPLAAEGLPSASLLPTTSQAARPGRARSARTGPPRRRPVGEPMTRRLATRAADSASDAVNAVWASATRGLLLILAFALGVGGLVASTGLAETARAQVSDRIDAAALSRLAFTDERKPAPNAHEPGHSAPQAEQYRAVPEPSELHAVEEAVSRLAGVVSVGFEGLDPVQGVTRVVGLHTVDRQKPVSIAAASAGRMRQIDPAPLPLWDDEAGGDQAVLGADAAQALSVDRAAPEVTVYVGSAHTSVVRVLAPRGDPLVDSRVFVNPAAARKTGPFRLSYTVETRPGFTTALAEAIPRTLSPGSPGAIHVQTTADLRSLRRGVGSDLSVMAGVLSAVLLLLASLSAATSMHLSVVSRTGEISLRRALGQSRGSVARQFIAEGAVMGLAGGTLGILFGILAVLALSLVNGWTPVLDPAAMTSLGLATGTGVGALAAALPASKAARIEPAAGLRL
ncbi:ABC transporter ATP-binding protein/permease [Arthrobacter sp. UM1]|uniref:ABC transporter ATP-binding protein/permease n=1 Tax=Arthrobacter sp. UM1 TaxID=2766776 RepID=UPI001CF62734|nr:ABC transporter ATP-binding protein/permease [Arthrobacter sp. UM1]MCB4208991.1 ATP-binding cassette domain-containing protein [Arthrobacter sp. UM1]